MILVSFLYEKVCIGYGGLVHIDWQSKKAELSFLVDTQRYLDIKTYTADFSAYLHLIKILAFKHLPFNRLYTITYNIRPYHIKILERNGFKREGIMKEDIRIGSKYVDVLVHGFLKKYL